MKTTKQQKDVRTTISMAWVVWGMAERMMIAKGFNRNFSAYVADLIRRDLEKESTKEPPKSTPPEYRIHHTHAEMNEQPKPITAPHEPK